jgi:hypothetical protein
VEKCYANFKMLKVAFGEQIMGRTRVYEQFSILKSTVTSAKGLSNAWNAQCPLMSKKEENVYRQNVLIYIKHYYL